MKIQKRRYCRFCGEKLVKVLNLGKIPPVNFYPEPEKVKDVKKYPLEIAVCSICELLQLSTLLDPTELFSNYHYKTGASEGLVKGLKELAKLCIAEFNLGVDSRVLDIGSNDGTFLQNFTRMRVLGIDPGREVSLIAKKKGIRVIRDFFNLKLAQKLQKHKESFDLVTSLHNLANIPDINNFLAGVKIVLNSRGILVIEVADAARMIKHGLFDSIYHEHYNYFSLPVLRRILQSNGFEIFRSQRNLNQGGSIRVFAKHSQGKLSIKKPKIILRKYWDYAEEFERVKRELNKVFIKIKNKKVIGFGAPAKAVVVANILKLNNKQIKFIVDSTELKQNKLLPGTNILVLSEEYLGKHKPECIFVFAWNYQEGILEKLKRNKGLVVIIPFPNLRIVQL